MTHTPGPWRVVHAREDAKDVFHIYTDGLEKDTPIAYADAYNPRVALANARLIAASPAMYAYISQRAEGGDPEAAKIVEAINAAS